MIYDAPTQVFDQNENNWRWAVIENQIRLSIKQGVTPHATFHLFDRMPSRFRAHIHNFMRREGWVIDDPLNYVVDHPDRFAEKQLKLENLNTNQQGCTHKISAEKNTESLEFSKAFNADSESLGKFQSLFGAPSRPLQVSDDENNNEEDEENKNSSQNHSSIYDDGPGYSCSGRTTRTDVRANLQSIKNILRS